MILPEKKLAEQLFNQFCAGYRKRDLTSLLSLFTKDINMWGSGLDEYRVGLKQAEEQLKRDWSQSENGEIEIVSFVPTPANALWTAAVCNAKVTIAGKQHIFPHLRGTIMLEKEDNVWKIAHIHASFPDYRNPENGSFPVE
ncbi:MAG: nuclear transport factor 2 family protein [Gammaproteobacteria bacterium]